MRPFLVSGRFASRRLQTGLPVKRKYQPVFASSASSVFLIFSLAVAN
jgi:hypothetical protein